MTFPVAQLPLWSTSWWSGLSVSLPYFPWSPSCLLSFSCTKLFRIPPNSPLSSQTLPKCSGYLLTIGRTVEGSPISLLPKGWLREPSKPSYHPLFPSILHLFYNILIVGCQTSSLTRPWCLWGQSCKHSIIIW